MKDLKEIKQACGPMKKQSIKIIAIDSLGKRLVAEGNYNTKTAARIRNIVYKNLEVEA